MFNLLCMDLRRLVRNRSLYIILGVTAVLLLLVTIMVSDIADPETMDMMEAQGAEITESDRIMSGHIQGMSQMDLIHETLGGGFLLVMTGIGMTLFVGGDFSSGFIKNICCARPRRRDYVLSKALLAGVYSGVMVALSIPWMLLSFAVVHLVQAPVPLPLVLRYAFWMWLAHWAFGLMALGLVLLSRNTTLGIILSLVSGSGLTTLLIGALCGLLGLPHLEQHFLSSVIAAFGTPQAGMTVMAVLYSAGWGMIYLTGSLLLMEKRDI